MIKILLDEAITFDMLTILLVKSQVSPSNKNSENYLDLYSQIREQIGGEKLKTILASSEYENLRRVNKETFMLVDKAKTDECLASEVDQANYRRFLAKKALQERFFSGEFGEQKIGYAPTN